MSTEQTPASPLVITPGPKKIFNVEVHLSEAQLKFMCECDGDEDFEYLEGYDDMVADGFEDPIDPDPSFNMGLGADINDIVSLGFLVMSKIYAGQIKTEIKLEDLNFHAFRNRVPIIKSIEFDYTDCKIVHPYHMITAAIDSSTGQQITIEEAIALKQKNAGDE